MNFPMMLGFLILIAFIVYGKPACSTATAAGNTEESVCPNYPSTVACFADACLNNNCTTSETCCADYSKGCEYHCIAKIQKRCPSYPINVNCEFNPCSLAKCGPKKICCADYSSGCSTSHCISI